MQLERQFESMGARVKVNIATPRRNAEFASPAVLDIRHDKHGELFSIERLSGVRLEISDTRPDQRHLVLAVIDPRPRRGHRVSQFLCGHDERSWFVAAVPESRNRLSVQDAMDALKPPEVWREIRRLDLAVDERNSRKNAAFVRQGEWFFIPDPGLKVRRSEIVKREPIRRGAGKPHMCDELHRYGGSMVFISSRYPNGLTHVQYNKLPDEERESQRWTRMVREAAVWVRGRIRHPDHATIRLDIWHRVVMNTETRARAMRHVAFLD